MLPLFPLIAPAPPAIVSQAPARTLRTEKTLAPGVVLIQEVIPEGALGGPLTINVVRLSPEVVGKNLSAALGQDRVWGTDPTFGRETVSGLATRRGVLVAINAGFFPFEGNPIGLHVDGGELVTEPSRTRSSLVVTEDGKATVRAFQWAGTVSIGDESKPLHGLNRRPGKGGELLAFTSKFFSKTLPTPDRVEVVLDGAPSPLRPGAKFSATVKSVSTGGETLLEPGAFVLSGGGPVADWLKEKAVVGASLTLELAVTAVRGEALDPLTIRHAVTGAGRLLTAGQVDVVLKPESISEAFSTTRHPRTAAGVCADGSVLLVTVDGRQPKLSRGVSLTELALLMKRFGATDALNLDGGGSTAMAVFGGIVNAPSDATERAVADMLIVTTPASDAKPASSSGFSLAWPQLTLKVGDTFAYPKPSGVPESKIFWSMRGNVGFLDQRGTFRATRPGVGKIRLHVDGRAAEIEVKVEAAPKAP